MLAAAKKAIANITLKNEASGVELPYIPKIFVGGTGVSGPTFVDNERYREYVFQEFNARCLDMETATAAHIAYQNNISFLFFRSLSDLAGADQDANVMSTFFSLAAENAFTVTYAVIEELYPTPTTAIEPPVVTTPNTTTSTTPTPTKSSATTVLFLSNVKALMPIASFFVGFLL